MTAEKLFLLLLDRSLAAGWLILALLLLRPFLRRVSRSLCCAMWSLVAFRLLCPFSFESVLSVLPGTRTVSADFSEQPFGKVVTVIWLIGVLLLALYMVGSYWHLRFLVQEAVKKEDGVWLCDRIDTPFILGVIRPRILLPFSMDAEDIPWVLAHERAHLARRDHWRKPIAFVLLAVFWFQPALWIAYVLLGRDIEFACDERTLRALGGDDESKACYAKALLRGSVPHVVAAKLYCPLAFGGLQTKQRVQSVLKYRRPAVALLLAAAVVCGAVAVCFLTDPKEEAVTSVGTTEPDQVLEASDEPPAEKSEDNDEPLEQLPTESADSPVERPPIKLMVATSPKKGTTEPSYQSTPAIPHPENISFEDWMRMRDLFISEDEWMLCYVLNHRIQSWYENGNFELPAEIAEKYGTTDSEQLPPIIVYTSVGELDSVEVIKVDFYSDQVDENGNPYEWTEIITIEIPAGEVAYCVLDPGEGAHSGGFAIVAGVYGDLYVEPVRW